VKTTHTPGPWEVDGDGFVVGGEGDAPNADFVSLRFITALTVSRHHRPDQREQDANARLMAAAPDLLAALKHVRDCQSCAQADWSACPRGGQQALLALAKAER
jgi:hypothetical protein